MQRPACILNVSAFPAGFDGVNGNSLLWILYLILDVLLGLQISQNDSYTMFWRLQFSLLSAVLPQGWQFWLPQ
jgi:hypothetical protein